MSDKSRERLDTQFRDVLEQIREQDERWQSLRQQLQNAGEVQFVLDELPEPQAARLAPPIPLGLRG